MRVWWRVLLVGLLVFGLGTGDAVAKKKKKGKNKGKDKIELTGIQAFDDVFARVDEIDGRLRSAERSLNGGQRELNTSLELKKGTPFTDAVAELKERAEGKLQLTVDKQNVPKLGVTDAVPTNVQTSVDAFNALTLDVTNSLTDLAAIGPEIDKLVKKTNKMPSKLKDEFKKDGAGWLDLIFKLPKTSKALTTDIKITGGLPGRATAVTTEMTELLGIAKSAFPVGDDGGGGKGGKGNGDGGPKERDTDQGDDGGGDRGSNREGSGSSTPAKPAPVPRAGKDD